MLSQQSFSVSHLLWVPLILTFLSIRSSLLQCCVHSDASEDGILEEPECVDMLASIVCCIYVCVLYLSLAPYLTTCCDDQILCREPD